jgi:protein TonB
VKGVVLVRVRVLENGKVGEVAFARSSGNSDLDAAALKAAAKWRFKPVLRDDEVVATWLEVSVRYVLKDS